MSNPLTIILTTVSNLDDADRFASALLDQKIAACVSIQSPITSYYTWKGDRCRESEIPIMIKSSPSHLPALSDYFHAHHPYDCPEFIILEGEGSDSYTDWIRTQLRPL